MPDSPTPPSPLLKSHRSLVSSTRGMSTGILLGSGFAVAVGGLGWLGHRADLKYGTEPWWTLAGAGLGLLYGAYEVWKLTRTTREEEMEDSEHQTVNIEHRTSK